ncbi:MAG: hypothetical protein U0169_01135 [Polyangiaceae bacterium]
MVAVVVGLVAVLWVALVPATASAQTVPAVTVNPTVRRLLPDGSEIATRAQNLTPNGINFDDCVSNLRLSFNLTLTNGPFSNYKLQIWAGGSDCGPLTARTGTNAVCWPVLGSDVPQVTPVDVAVRAQDIVAYQNATTKPLTYSAANESACYVQQQSGTTKIGLYFLWLDGTGNPVSQANYDVPSDLRGPAAPTNLTTEIGQAVTLKFTSAADSDIQGFKAYCSPPIGEEDTYVGSGSTVVETCPDATASETPSTSDASSVEGGDVADSGAPSDAATSSTVDAACTRTVVSAAACTSDVFGIADGGQAKIDKRFLCGEIGGGTSSTLIIKNLKQNVQYTIALAATDGIDNVGPLSTAICATPVQVDDFWVSYKQNGGSATGLCALEAVGMPVSGSAAFLMFGATLLTYVRRRKSR